MRQANDRGFVLISTMVILTILTGLGTALSLLATQDLRMARFYQERQQAFYAAESGLNVALVEARRLYRSRPDAFFDVAPQALTIPRTKLSSSPDAYYQVAASRTGNRIDVVSDGEVITGSDSRRVSLQFALEGVPAALPSLFVADIVDLSEPYWRENYAVTEVRVPTWEKFQDEIRELNPTQQLFVPQAPTGEHTLFTTSLVVKSPWRIEAPDGGLCIYVNGSVVLDDRLLISGTGPVKLVINGSLVIDGNSSILMDNLADVDIYVLDSVVIGGSALVRKTPDPASSTWGVFHIGRSFTLSGSVDIGAENPLPSKANIVFLMDTGRNDGITINGSKVMEAGIYAPTRFISFNGNQKLFDGSIVAKSMLKVKGNFVYDEHLGKFARGNDGVGGGDGSVFVVEGSWREN